MADYERRIIDQVNGWRAKASDVPYLRFPADWEIKVTPPFAGADARFTVRCGEATVSVYLDFDGNLGCMERPYWEIYPLDGDCARYYLYETDELLQGIALSIRQQNEDEAT